MNDSEILEMLKADLEKLTVPVSTERYLKMLISTAKEEISRMGITLNDSFADGQTIEMYAAYLYRRRADADNGMPRMLQFRLHNRLFSEKGSL